MNGSLLRFQWVFGVILLLFATGVRLLLIETARFTDDEASFYQTIFEIFHGKNFPLLGPPLTGGEARHPGPLFFYGMSISQWIQATPEMANALVAGMGGFSVWLFWRALLTRFSFLTTSLVSLYLAASPWSILYADRLWNSNVIGFFVALAFYCTFKLLQNKNTPWIGLWIFSLGILPQFHMSAPIIWVALISFLYFSLNLSVSFSQSISWNRKAIFWGSIALLMAYVPLFIHEGQTQFGNLRAFFSSSGQGAREVWGFRWLPLYLIRFLSVDISYHELRGYWGGLNEFQAVASNWVGHDLRGFSLSHFAVVASSWAFSIWIWAQTLRKRNDASFRPIFLALTLGLLTNILLLAFARKPYYPHYTQPLLPIFFLAMAAILETLSQNHFQKIAALIGIFSVFGMGSSLKLSHTLDARNGLRTQRAVIEYLIEHRHAEQPIRLELDFPGSLEAYRVLSETQYSGRLRLTQNPDAPRYLVSKKKDRSGVPPLWQHGTLSLYRVDFQDRTQ